MTRHYDREGRPITLEQWAELLEDRTTNYKVVERTECDHVWVSTVWLGLDHSWTKDGPPIIFETMVFRQPTDLDRLARVIGERTDEMRELDTDRYSTEAEARTGHARLVELWRHKLPLAQQADSDV